jgi:hypothetical protein
MPICVISVGSSSLTSSALFAISAAESDTAVLRRIYQSMFALNRRINANPRQPARWLRAGDATRCATISSSRLAMPLVIHCADIGSVKNGNFGWARLAIDEPSSVCTTGRDIEQFAEGIAADINAGVRVALGFECPLFLPFPNDPEDLTSARPGEGDRAWSAGAGAGVLATGLTETVRILDQVRRRTNGSCAVFVSGVRQLVMFSRRCERLIHLGGLRHESCQGRHSSRRRQVGRAQLSQLPSGVGTAQCGHLRRQGAVTVRGSPSADWLGYRPVLAERVMHRCARPTKQ